MPCSREHDAVMAALIRLFGRRTAGRVSLSLEPDARSPRRGGAGGERRAAARARRRRRRGDARIEVDSHLAERLYLNPVTFGYSTCWWDWGRWEREIDWMALHGVNRPLAMEGQEYVERGLWRSCGLSAKDLAGHFAGAAWLPWERMGNLTAHGGPLPSHAIDDRRALQRRILRRCRGLGMKTVTPGFSGFIPDALAKRLPRGATIDLPLWSGRHPPCARTRTPFRPRRVARQHPRVGGTLDHGANARPGTRPDARRRHGAASPRALSPHPPGKWT